MCMKRQVSELSSYYPYCLDCHDAQTYIMKGANSIKEIGTDAENVATLHAFLEHESKREVSVTVAAVVYTLIAKIAKILEKMH